ncbi:hypothetical protein [Oribacterium sp. oral taxon 102]|uniref:hypothetical protein n=1 Tax=Oribacterium sp. oral taxon 102 TaxID=671214 RepID=UPI001FAC9162|nr:hypothetical protein [Oribacterium sp. oral taxon 102]
MMAVAKKIGTKKPVFVALIVPKPEPKPQIEIPADIVGRQVKHKAFGLGKITAIEGTTIVVQFDKIGLKKMGMNSAWKRSCWSLYKEYEDD